MFETIALVNTLPALAHCLERGEFLHLSNKTTLDGVCLMGFSQREGEYISTLNYQPCVLMQRRTRKDKGSMPKNPL